MGYALKIFPNELVLSTLFTVASIFLSIGLSLIITFDFSKIGNDNFYNIIKKNIDRVRKVFLMYFCVMTFAYLAGMYFIKCELSWAVTSIKLLGMAIVPSQAVISITFSLLLLGLCCFIMNFIHLQKLKNDIDARLRENKNCGH